MSFIRRHGFRIRAAIDPGEEYDVEDYAYCRWLIDQAVKEPHDATQETATSPGV